MKYIVKLSYIKAELNEKKSMFADMKQGNESQIEMHLLCR